MNARNFEIDWLSGVLVSLFAIVNGVALWMVHSRLTSATAPAEPTQTASASMGGRIILLVVVEVAAIVILWRVYGYLPRKWQKRVKTVAKGIVLGIVVLMGYRVWTLTVGPGWQYLVGVLGVVLIKRRVEPNGFAWIAWNMIGVSVAVIAAVIGGSTLAPGLIIGLMVLFLAYDKIAVDWTNIMGDLVQFSQNARIPNVLIIPSTVRFDLDSLREYVNGGEKPDNIGMVIGVGDFMFPTLLSVSAATAVESVTSPVVLLTILGTMVAALVLRDAKTRAETLPALPWLNTGAIIGFLVGSLVVSESLIVLLGL
jgi:presenilin-like A22 family membrane protease